MAGPERNRVVANRRFNANWEHEFLFTERNGAATCLVCQKIVSEKKVTAVRRHYNTHEEYHNTSGNDRENLIEELREALKRNKANEDSDAALRASYAVAVNVAKASKPFREGEFIKQCLIDVTNILCPDVVSTLNTVCLSRTTIARRIDDMATDLKHQLKDRINDFIVFSLALDESTDIQDIAQLAIFIRGVSDNLAITEELLSLIPLRGTAKGEDIFSAVVSCMEEFNLPLDKLTSVTTDGAPAMTGKRQGFAGRVTEKLTAMGCSPVPFIHCILHLESLCAKTLNLGNVMNVVVKCVNFIRSRSLNHRQFSELLEACDASFKDLPYHSEVRWLSRGKVLKVVFELRNEISMFLKEKNNHVPELNDTNWVCDLAFMSDIFSHLNNLNIQLQGRNELITNLFDRIEAFLRKLQLWSFQLKQKDCKHFPAVNSLKKEAYHRMQMYSEEIEKLREEFVQRFADFTALRSDFRLFTAPFSVPIEEVSDELQMECIDLQCDSTMRDVFDRKVRKNFMLESVRTCIQKFVPQLHGYYQCSAQLIFVSSFSLA